MKVFLRVSDQRQGFFLLGVSNVVHQMSLFLQLDIPGNMLFGYFPPKRFR